MSADNQERSDDILDGGMIAGGIIIAILLSLCIIMCVLDCKKTKQKRSARARRLVRDLEAQTRAHNQTSQPLPPAQAGDFSGFDFSNNPYTQPTIPEPAHQPVQEPNGRPTMQRRQTADGATGNPELRRKPSFTNIAKGERSPKPSPKQPLVHPDEFELEDIDLRNK